MSTVFGGARLLYPVGEVTHKVEEEVGLGHRDDLVGDLDEQAKALGRLEAQPIGDALTKVFGSRARVDLERLVRVVREVDFVEDLRRLVLDRLNLHLMRRVLALSVPCKF